MTFFCFSIMSNVIAPDVGPDISAIPVQYMCDSLFRNKRFMLDEMTQQNASKFAIFWE